MLAKIEYTPKLDFLKSPKITERYEYRSNNYLYLVRTNADTGQVLDEIKTNRKRKTQY